MSIFDDDSFADMIGASTGGDAPAPAPAAAAAAPAPAPAAAPTTADGSMPDPFALPDPFAAPAAAPASTLGAVPAAQAPVPLPAEALAQVTADGETPPPAEQTAQLVARAAEATPPEAEAMAVWLADRLANGMGELTGSIPITLKTLNIISAMAEGSPTFRAAALASCAAAVATAQSFDRADPVHGDMPANAVRTTAAKLQALLQKKEGMAAMKSMGGGLLKRGKAKAAEAAKIAEEKTKEAAKLAEEKAKLAKDAAKDGSMLTAVQGAAVGVAASAQASARGVTSALAEGASERNKLKFVGKAPMAEAKPMLEEAMAAYTVRHSALLSG
jgi:hypothetical protein